MKIATKIVLLFSLPAARLVCTIKQLTTKTVKIQFDILQLVFADSKVENKKVENEIEAEPLVTNDWRKKTNVLCSQV